MKNLIIYSGIALVALANTNYKSFDSKKEVKTPKEIRKEIVIDRSFKSEFSKSKKLSISNKATTLHYRTLFLRNFEKNIVNKTIREDEPIDMATTIRMNKTADQLIAEDNLITENNISNETQALDFDIIDGNEVVDPLTGTKTEKTADQLIDEDNAITENNISNEIQSLDFDIINSNEVVESINTFKIEITADQHFAEDNLITENNISNETQYLDFEIINKIAKSIN